MLSHCPNCGRRFNCDGGEACWCLKVERNFDYEEMVRRTGAMRCVCPVCLSGRMDRAEADARQSGGAAQPPLSRRRRGRRRNNRDSQD